MDYIKKREGNTWVILINQPVVSSDLAAAILINAALVSGSLRF
jgi:hypothetical protein